MMEEKREIYEKDLENSSLVSSEEKYFKVGRSESAMYWKYYEGENKDEEDEYEESISFGDQGNRRNTNRFL